MQGHVCLVLAHHVPSANINVQSTKSLKMMSGQESNNLQREENLGNHRVHLLEDGVRNLKKSHNIWNLAERNVMIS